MRQQRSRKITSILRQAAEADPARGGGGSITLIPAASAGTLAAGQGAISCNAPRLKLVDYTTNGCHAAVLPFSTDTFDWDSSVLTARYRNAVTPLECFASKPAEFLRLRDAIDVAPAASGQPDKQTRHRACIGLRRKVAGGWRFM